MTDNNEFEIYTNGYIKLQSIDEEYRCPDCETVMARRYKRSIIIPKPKTILLRNDGVVIICKGCNAALSLKKEYGFSKWQGSVSENPGV